MPRPDETPLTEEELKEAGIEEPRGTKTLKEVEETPRDPEADRAAHLARNATLKALGL